MKKIATLLLAAGLVFGASTGASAIDFKAKGQWIMSFDYGQNGGFTGGNGITGWGRGDQDEFEATQRLRLQLDAVASEALSGTVFFEIGNQRWGSENQEFGGGALGADGNQAVKVRRAYIDWLVPETDLKVRMGIQGLMLPSFTAGSQVLDDDMAGVTLSYKFTDNVGLTAFWARLYNDNYTGTRANGRSINSYMDNVDAFGLVMPLTFDGVKVTPWVMYAAIGPNALRGRNGNALDNLGGGLAGNARGQFLSGMVPVGGSLHKDGTTAAKRLNRYGDAFWFGLTGDITALDPFRIAWDFNYGGVWYGDSRMNRSGWLASLLFEYKLDWAIPGIYGWYGSGDDDNPANGSERMPVIHANGNNDFSNFAFNGNPYIAREGVLSKHMAGTWGVGVRLKDMSFLENLKHTLRLNLIGGTNSTTMTRYLTGRRGNVFGGAIAGQAGVAGMDNLYMTTNDTVLEIGLTNAYKMYDNFTIMLDAAYLATWLDHDKSVWGNSVMNGKSDQVRDPWNVNLSFVYEF